jgi:hypothetical protein
MLDPDGPDYRLTWELRHAAAPPPLRLKKTVDLWFVPAGLEPDAMTIGKLAADRPMRYGDLVDAVVVALKVSVATAKRRIAAAVGSKALDTDPDGRYFPGDAWYQQAHEGSHRG